MAQVKYQATKLNDRGLGAVALEEIKAGETILEERALLAVSDATSVRQFRSRAPAGTERLIAAYDYFRTRMSRKDQQKFLSLSLPLTGGSKNPCRLTARRFVPIGLISKDEVENAAMCINIMRLHGFDDTDGVMVFAEGSRFNHSCQPNCYEDIFDGVSTIRATRCIQAGEELTVEYNENMHLDPTYRRRQRLLRGKGFTCHCPRCDDPADDTKWFPCYNRKCTGNHYACQPVGEGPVIDIGGDLAYYTGVEYVEPHLLPCTVCQRSPPLEYQAAMFVMEAYAELAAPSIRQTASQLYSQETAKLRTLMKEVDALQCPIQHGVGIRLANDEMPFRAALLRAEDKGQRRRLQALASEVEAACERIMPYAHAVKATHLYPVAFTYDLLGEADKAVEVARKLLRTERILFGRDNGRAEKEELVLMMARDHPREFHRQVQGQQTGEGTKGTKEAPRCCYFCGETAEHAAMKFSSCGKCRQVKYCGKACQKAHWKFHKDQCKG